MKQAINEKILGPTLMVFLLMVMQTTSAIAQTPPKEQSSETQAGESGGTAETKSPSPGPYSGDIWHRSTLTGDWFGVRNDLAERGITLRLLFNSHIYTVYSNGYVGRTVE